MLIITGPRTTHSPACRGAVLKQFGCRRTENGGMPLYRCAHRLAPARRRSLVTINCARRVARRRTRSARNVNGHMHGLRSSFASTHPWPWH